MRWWREQPDAQARVRLNATSLRSLCLEAGADDVGFVELDREAIADQRSDILAAFGSGQRLPECRMNRENVRTPARSVANVEFHASYEEVNDVARTIVKTLTQIGVRGLYPSAGFPMKMDRFPGKIWVVSHQPVAVAAGLGHMGLHRNVIHPRFGNFISLGTILIDAAVTDYDQPIDYNPCIDCKLCGSLPCWSDRP